MLAALGQDDYVVALEINGQGHEHRAIERMAGRAPAGRRGRWRC